MLAVSPLQTILAPMFGAPSFSDALLASQLTLPPSPPLQAIGHTALFG